MDKILSTIIEESSDTGVIWKPTDKRRNSYHIVDETVRERHSKIHLHFTVKKDTALPFTCIIEGDYFFHVPSNKVAVVFTISQGIITTTCGHSCNIKYCDKIVGTTNPDLNLPSANNTFLTVYCEQDSILTVSLNLVKWFPSWENKFNYKLVLETDKNKVFEPLSTKESWTKDEVIDFGLWLNESYNDRYEYCKTKTIAELFQEWQRKTF